MHKYVFIPITNLEYNYYITTFLERNLILSIFLLKNLTDGERGKDSI